MSDTALVWSADSMLGALEPTSIVVAHQSLQAVVDSPYVAGASTASKFDELAQLGRLQSDWDGYGAEGIGAVTVEWARQLMMRIGPLPDAISPTPAGTVNMEWETPLGRASLEVGRTTYSFYASPRIGEPIYLLGDTQAHDAEDIRFALATIADAPAEETISRLDWPTGFETGD